METAQRKVVLRSDVDADAVDDLAVAAGWQARLIPASPGMVDLLLHLPIMDTTRARTELGWRPRYSATEALREVLDGLRGRAGMETPPLSPEGGVERIKRLMTGVGSRLL